MRCRFLLATLACLALSAPALAAVPPPQPRSGPGGAEKPDAEVVKRAVGRASAKTYLFHLAGTAAEPRPVVVFLPAWGATNPLTYGGWIDHLARRGYLVLFPAFQEIGRTRPADAVENAGTLLRDALATLRDDAAARPDGGRIAFLGHSAGAGIAAALAADAPTYKLPVPKAVFALMPGGVASDDKARGIQLGDLGKIDPSVSIVTMIGDREFQASDRVARRILRESTNVPVSHKLFMRAVSDDHGFPTLSAVLASPGSPLEGYEAATIKVQPDPPADPRAPKPARPRWSADMVLSGEQTVLVQGLGRNGTDTLDYLAFWRTFDMVMDQALGGGDMTTLRQNPAFLDMGRWSDGWPVRRLFAETPRPHDPNAAPAAASTATAAPATPSARQPVTRNRPRPRRDD